MSHNRRMRNYGVGLALLWVATTVDPSAAQTEEIPPAVAALLQQGKYEEAYTLALDGKTDPATIKRIALMLLNQSMQSSDSYVRWFALRAASPLTDPALADGARRVATSGDRYDQALALEIIGNVDPRTGREELVLSLDSPFRSVRLRGLQGLAKLEDPTLTERFAEVLSSDADPDLRAFAAGALANTHSPEAAGALYRALDDQVPVVQEEAVRSLVKLRDPGIGGVLRRRLGEENSDRRLHTIRLAGLVPDPDLAPVLAPFLADPEPEVRAHAAASILAILEQSPPKP